MSLHPADRIVMHVDMDCFFAAVEEREDPSLKGRPVIVGSDPKGGQGRGIVATCNYAARKFGLRSAMPISIAYRRCPSGVYLRPRFSLYTQASRKVMDLLRSAADVFEPAGIDEAYLDVSSRVTFESARDLARELQAGILGKEGLSASVGLGPNKLVAKIASDHRKPGGLTAVIPSRVAEFLDPKGVAILRGVGPKTREFLLSLGYETVAQLRAASREFLFREFGKFGLHLWDEARGIDDRPLDPSWDAKSIGREVTFETDTADAALVGETLLECVAEVHREMVSEGLWCRTLTVKARFSGYETHSKQTTLRLSTGGLAHLESGALSMLEPFLGQGRSLRLVGFSVAKFSPPEDLLPLGAGD
ncbi:MAG: DNA polymerase IV [Elusimicrobia bacterium]|nr:DNA polymerase IV [Elusimicrobiota bacterium]